MKNLVAIYDKKAKKYYPPNTVENLQAAIRDFKMLFNPKAGINTMTEYAEDYRLDKIAVFDENTGEIDNIGEFETLYEGKDAVKEWSEKK